MINKWLEGYEKKIDKLLKKTISFSNAKLIGIKITEFIYQKRTKQNNISLSDCIDIIKYICLTLGIVVEIDIKNLENKIKEIKENEDNLWYIKKENK